MQGKDFLYFLKDGDVFKYVDAYGNVRDTTTPKPLQFSPDGWNEISIHEGVNAKYGFGLDRSFTIPLNYVEDAATILRYCYYTYGASAKLELLILEQKLEVTNASGSLPYTIPFDLGGIGSYGYYYDFLYLGDIDFTTYDQEGAKVTANAIEGGPVKLLKANENTTYEIPMDVAESQWVKFDGINFQSASNYVTVDETIGTFLTSSGIYCVDWLQVQHVNNDGTIFDTEQQSTTPLTFVRSNTNLNDSGHADNYFFAANANVTVRIRFTVRITMADGSVVILYIKNSNGTRTTLATLIGSDLHSSNVEGTYTIDRSFTLAAGEKLYLLAQLTNTLATGITSSQATFYSTEISVTYVSRYKITYVKCLPLAYVYKKLCEKLGIIPSLALSNYLTTNANLVLTCGDALRGLTGSKIKTSLSQFYNSVNVPLNIGLGVINGVLRLEEKEYWLNGDIIELGEVASLKIYPDIDKLFNTLRIGFPDQTYDSVNGKDEFNNTLLFTVNAAGNKELTLVSDYRADCFGAEITRINLDGKKTTDANSDNDIWFIAKTTNPSAYMTLDSSPIYDLDRSLNATATGLIDPESVFNIPLSPKRCLLKHGWYIHSCLDKVGGYLVFQTTTKNAELVAGGIAEKGDVLIGSLDPIKFHPVLFDIETIVPDNYADLLFANPIRRYRFTYNGVTLSGIAIKSGIEPSTNKSQIFTLLADADCDLSQLIFLNE
jgi:hypothetical protein